MLRDVGIQGDEAPLVGRAHRPLTRVALAALRGVALGVQPLLLIAVVVANDPPITPPVLLEAVATWMVLPGVAAWVLARALAASLVVDGDGLTIARRDLRVTVPHDAIAAVRLWRLPLPGPGLALELRSGRRLRWSIEIADPARLLAALGRPHTSPLLDWASARAAARAGWRWWHPVVKFGLFAVPPAALLFSVHQHIAYGGFFGEYLLLSPRAWLATLVRHWAVVTIYLVLWASALRAGVESVCLAAVAVAPARAARVRRLTEIASAIGYWGGVPALVALRFAPW